MRHPRNRRAHPDFFTLFSLETLDLLQVVGKRREYSPKQQSNGKKPYKHTICGAQRHQLKVTSSIYLGKHHFEGHSPSNKQTPSHLPFQCPHQAPGCHSTEPSDLETAKALAHDSCLDFPIRKRNFEQTQRRMARSLKNPKGQVRLALLWPAIPRSKVAFGAIFKEHLGETMDPGQIEHIMVSHTVAKPLSYLLAECHGNKKHIYIH